MAVFTGQPKGAGFRRRARGRRVWRHSLLAAASSVLMLGVFEVLSSPDRLFRASMASAYAALVMFGSTLIIGPLNVLRERPNPVSTYLRRDIGIWAALLALAHVVFGLQVHMRGRMWLYFVYPAEESHFLPIRIDPFGLANYTGLAAMLVLALLLTLSNNTSLRALGTRRWKKLQRWNYGAFALTVVHGIAYQVIERRELLFVASGFAALLTVVTLQAAGLRRVLRWPSSPPEH
jgi:methionine sulfoxide reductase heme-binding subunit